MVGNVRHLAGMGGEGEGRQDPFRGQGGNRHGRAGDVPMVRRGKREMRSNNVCLTNRRRTEHDPLVHVWKVIETRTTCGIYFVWEAVESWTGRRVLFEGDSRWCAYFAGEPATCLWCLGAS